MQPESPPARKVPFFRSPLFDLLLFSLLLAVVGWLLLISANQLEYEWDWGSIPEYLLTKDGDGWHAGLLLQGLVITLQVSFFGLIGAFFVGLITALLRRSDSFMARALATLYLETSRNTPLLIQIFFIYFVFGPILGLGRFFSAVLALSLFDGAYTAEIFRSGIEAVPKGQYEAAKSLGLSPFVTWRHIIIPQALRKIVPPLTSQSISLVKDSALVSTIAIYDLTLQAQRIIAETYLTFEVWFVVASIYLVITLSLSFLAGFIKNIFEIP